ncbi:MAG: NAD(P)-dependent oxidoreductase [Verrucomicrobiota bacterium]
MSSRTRKNIGVIGLGIIGQRVVENLRRRGYHVFVWNRTPRPVPNFVGSAAEIAELCDYIQIFVSDDEALLQMIQQVKKHLTPKHVVMAHTTVSPETMRAAAEVVEKRGGQLVDAPFTGSKMAAENGKLVYYVAGAEEALRQVRPILQASSKEIIEVGRVGDATMIKLATNMVTAASVQATAEALALICKSGLPAEHFAAAMQHNGSHSATLEMKLPMMLEGNFDANFSVKHMLKDVVIATRLARSLGLEVGATDAACHALVEEMRQGRGDDDYASLVRQYFPDGGPLTQRPSEVDDQATFAGLEENAAPVVADSASAVVEPEVVEEAAPEIEASAAPVIPEEPAVPVAVYPPAAGR